MNPIYDVAHFLPDLDLFSRLPPNTDVHVSRLGHFVQNAGAYSSLLGAQTIANSWNTYTSERLAREVDDFAKQIIDTLKNLFDQANTSSDQQLRLRAFCELKLANTAIKNAIEGVETKGGMQGLLAQHTKEPYRSQLQAAINYMKDNSKHLQELSQQWLNLPKECRPDQAEALPFCPEAFFQNEDWEKAMDAAAKFRPETASTFKYYGQYSAALTLTQTNVSAGLWNWWDKILSFPAASLYLGALPMRRGAFGIEWRNDLQDLKAAGIGAVLSVVEVFENNSDGLVGSPIKPQEWKEAGIKQLQLPTLDFETISFELIQRGVAFIDWNIKSGRSVYVHCKAGRGRSALLEMCYLVKHQAYTAKDAFALIKKQRTQAGFADHSDKMKTLLEYEKFIQAQLAQENHEAK